ncbi:DoxX family protein [Chitinophaga horti]|uniref:DoxX family protein n=1 Tax=Chitinophaga horti TaxID=2920382 RepID=A0ABY6J9T8_9BACT|nr:DoxX family protein [Chitinophaga horti]UYQ95332.1 DoxX family protein [Chitinophaga horti]
MNTALWIVQAILGISFILAGVRKLIEQKIKLAAQVPWTGRFPAAVVKGIGILEILAGLGFILPHLTGVQPHLTPLSALAVAGAMVFAAIHHLRYKEGKEAIVNVVVLILAGFVALGRNEENYLGLL